jgi:hypothetical protein
MRRFWHGVFLSRNRHCGILISVCVRRNAVAESYEELEDAIEAIWENLPPYAMTIVADTGALPCEFVSAVARLISTQSPTLQPITDAQKTEVARSAMAKREPGFWWVRPTLDRLIELNEDAQRLLAQAIELTKAGQQL